MKILHYAIIALHQHDIDHPEWENGQAEMDFGNQYQVNNYKVKVSPKL